MTMSSPLAAPARICGPRLTTSRVLTLTAVTTVASCLMAPPAGAAPGGPRGSAPTTIALLADTPYGDRQRAQFPALIDAIDADPRIRLVLHAGDVKSGSTTCDDARFADLAALYDTFDDPFVLTPGDNEWTDCHRTAAGGYLPTERPEAVREVFFPQPGRALGERSMGVTTQSTEQPEHAAYVENVRFERSRVTFATVHVVGSENNLDPWTQLPGGDRPQERLMEFEARRAANLDWINATFDEAERSGAAGVVLMMQAEPTATPGFAAERELIVQRATAFGRPVLLTHGDEHVYEEERVYAAAPNLTRLETYGATATEWLALTVDPRTAGVFSWEPRTVGASG